MQALIYNATCFGKFVIKLFILFSCCSQVQISAVPVRSGWACAKAIVRGAVRGQRYVTDPPWFKATYIWKVIFPELLEWSYRLLYISRPGAPATEAASKRILDVT